MKKITLIACAFVTGNLFAQLPVSTAPSNKKAVIEEFTGVYCGYCPDGHKIGTNLHNADPNNVILINIHSGGYANVNPGEPDFKTPEGTAVDGMQGMGITGYPAGDVNREVLVGTVMAAGRGSWASMANTIKSQAAYCNVACQGTVDPLTRVLTVQVEVYYTANSPVSTNSLNVYLLESKVPGKQVDYGNYNPTNWNPDGSYNHNHVLRKSLTNNFGVTIANTTSGTLYTNTFTYTIPSTYGATGKTTPALLENMELVAFVTQSDRKVINADDGPVKMTNDAKAISASAPAMDCSANLSPVVTVQNNGINTITSLVITPAIDNITKTPTTWNGNLTAGASTTIALTPFANSTNSGNHTLTYTITSVTPSDTYLGNNSAKITFYSAIAYQGTPVSEGFAATAYPPAGWAVMNANAGPSWTRNNQNGAYNLSSECTRYDFYSNSLVGDIDELMLPPLDLTGTTKAMTFDYAYSMRDENSNDKLEVMISDDCGTTWSTVWSLSGTMLHTAMAPTTGGYIPAITDWQNIYVDLSAVNKNLSQIFTKFVTTNDHGNYLYIDNVNLAQKPAPNPVGLSTVGKNSYNAAIFPNPSNSIVNVKVNSPISTSAKVSVISTLGQVVFVKETHLSEGTNLMSIEVKDLPAGLYSVVINSEKGAITKMLTVTK